MASGKYSAIACFSPAWLSVTTNCTALRPRSRIRDRKSRQLLLLSRFTSSTASTERLPSQLMPMAIWTAWDRMTPSSRTFS